MERKPVKSSTVVSIGYDEDTKVLEVEFKKGIYQYAEVPREIHEQLLNAESIGKFLNGTVKPTYKFTKIS